MHQKQPPAKIAVLVAEGVGSAARQEIVASRQGGQGKNQKNEMFSHLWFEGLTRVY